MSAERPAAYTSEVIRTGHWPFAWGFVIRKNGEFVYGEKNIESRRLAQKYADDLIYQPEPVESLLDEDDFAVIAEENLESPRDASDAASDAHCEQNAITETSQRGLDYQSGEPAGAVNSGSAPASRDEFTDEDAERMLWLSGIVGVSARSITDEGAQELHSLCLKALRMLGKSPAGRFPVSRG